MKLPNLPTVVKGFIEGPVRWEKNGGGDLYTNGLEPGKEWGVLKDVAPRMFNGEMYAITHLQKKSKRGWLLMKPFCFHKWYTYKFQEKDANGNWIPGSEKVFYFRSPGWRWDAGDGKFILTKGYVGFHWD